MTQTPTDPIRDEAVRVLAEALDPVGVLGGKPEFAANIAMRHPTLARRLALGTAWDAAVAALPEDARKALAAAMPTLVRSLGEVE